MSNKYMVVANWAGAVFVKEHSYYVSQGGYRQAWGDRWLPVNAGSIEQAREIGCQLFPEAKPYDRQAPAGYRRTL